MQLLVVLYVRLELGFELIIPKYLSIIPFQHSHDTYRLFPTSPPNILVQKNLFLQHDIVMRYNTHLTLTHIILHATLELFQCNLAVPDHRDHRRISAAERILCQQLLRMTEYTPFGRKLSRQALPKSFPFDTAISSSENSFALCAGVTDFGSAAPLPHDRRRPCGGVLQCTLRFQVNSGKRVASNLCRTIGI